MNVFFGRCSTAAFFMPVIGEPCVYETLQHPLRRLRQENPKTCSSSRAQRGRVRVCAEWIVATATPPDAASFYSSAATNGLCSRCRRLRQGHPKVCSSSRAQRGRVRVCAEWIVTTATPPDAASFYSSAATNDLCSRCRRLRQGHPKTCSSSRAQRGRVRVCAEWIVAKATPPDATSFYSSAATNGLCSRCRRLRQGHPKSAARLRFKRCLSATVRQTG